LIGFGGAASTSTFLAVDRGSKQWALHARLVHNVVDRREWSGAPPFDIAAALGLSDEDRAERPVLLLESDGGPIPFLAFGRISFRQLDAARVQPVPAIVRNPLERQLVSAVVLEDDGPPLVVLDPVMLMSMAKEASAT
jgi:hypothetical protein